MIILIILIIILIIITTIAIIIEKRNYNKGICRICGKELKFFDMDSQGGRGYICPNGHTVWVTYLLIDKNQKEIKK